MTRPRKNNGASRIQTRDLPLSQRTPKPLGQWGGHTREQMLHWPHQKLLILADIWTFMITFLPTWHDNSHHWNLHLDRLLRSEMWVNNICLHLSTHKDKSIQTKLEMLMNSNDLMKFKSRVSFEQTGHTEMTMHTKPGIPSFANLSSDTRDTKHTAHHCGFFTSMEGFFH